MHTSTNPSAAETIVTVAGVGKTYATGFQALKTST